MGVEYTAVTGFGVLASELPEEHQDLEESFGLEINGEEDKDGICALYTNNYQTKPKVFVGFLLCKARNSKVETIDASVFAPQKLLTKSETFEDRFGIKPRLLTFVMVD